MSMTIQSSAKNKILVTSSKASKECEIRYHPGKANGVADAIRGVMDEPHASSGSMVQTLEDIMRACVIDFGGSYHSSIRCTPFEALYGRKCKSPVLWAEIGESSLIGLELLGEIPEMSSRWMFLSVWSGYAAMSTLMWAVKVVSIDKWSRVGLDIEADEDEEEEEHLAPADSVVVALPTMDQALSAEETKPFETDESAATPPPHPAYRVTARISIPAPVPTPVWSDVEVARLLAISTPPSSPLSPWSSPLPQIPSPPLPPLPSPSLQLSPPSPMLSPAPPLSPFRSLGYRAAMIRLRAVATSTSHSLPLPPPFILSPTRSDAPSSGIPPPLPISVPTSSPPLLLPSASHREDRPEVTLPSRKRLGIALSPRYKVGESSSAAAAKPAEGLRTDYGFVATMDREIRRDPEREVRYRITDSWDEIVGTLDRRAHAYTRHLMETEARLSREAWRRSMDASDLARGEVMSLRTTVLGQILEIRELHATDRRRQAMTSKMLKADHRRSAEMRELRTADHTRQQQLIQTLTVMQSLQGHVTTLQGQVAALQGQVTALQGQQGPAGGPAQPELPEEAGSSS
ncbi:hypothetical protein Tco_0228430 [Tanacetum coccineum]